MLNLDCALSWSSRRARNDPGSFHWHVRPPGSSWMPGQTPGPGHYEIPHDLHHVPKFHHTIQSRSVVCTRTISSNIEYRGRRSFPSCRPMAIGIREKLKYYICDDTPGPSMPHPKTLPEPPIHIGKWFSAELTPDNVPGPGQYDPVVKTAPRLVVQMNRAEYRDSIWKPVVGVPGPGAYDPFPGPGRPRRWAVKLRNANPYPVVQLKRTAIKAPLSSLQKEPIQQAIDCVEVM
jgi:hypothetical protein